MKKENFKEITLNDLNDLRTDLMEVYKEMRAGRLGVRDGKEFANIAGRIMQTVALQLTAIKLTNDFRNPEEIKQLEEKQKKDVSEFLGNK